MSLVLLFLWVASPVGQLDVAVRFDNDPQVGAPGSLPGSFVCLGGQVLFVAGNARLGCELWISDGTSAGTRVVKDIFPGPGSGLEARTPLYVHDDRLFFAADDGQHGRELWISDGTHEGTRRLGDLRPGHNGSDPGHFGSLGSEVVFLTRDSYRSWYSDGSGVHFHEYTYAVWASDGTPEGTRRLRSIPTGYGNEDQPVKAVGLLNGRWVWRVPSGHYSDQGYHRVPSVLVATDGTLAGTKTILTLEQAFPSEPWEISDVAIVNGSLLFFVRQNSADLPVLMKADGWSDHMTPISSLGAMSWTQLNDRLYFIPESAPGRVARTDGTSEGTILLPDLFDETSTWSLELVSSIGDTLAVDRKEFSDITVMSRLWFLDTEVLGAVPAQQEDLAVSGSMVQDPENEAAYFLGSSGGSFGIWRTQGSPESTERIHEMQPGEGIDVGGAIVFQGDLICAISTPEERGEPYRIGRDGSRRQVADIYDVPSPINLFAEGDQVFFTARAGVGPSHGMLADSMVGLYATSAHELKTTELAFMYSEFGNCEHVVSDVETTDSGIAFSLRGTCWISDGTVSGTQPVTVAGEATLLSLHHIPNKLAPHFLTFTSAGLFFADLRFAEGTAALACAPLDGPAPYRGNTCWIGDSIHVPSTENRPQPNAFLGPLCVVEPFLWMAHPSEDHWELSGVDLDRWDGLSTSFSELVESIHGFGNLQPTEMIAFRQGVLVTAVGDLETPKLMQCDGGGCEVVAEFPDARTLSGLETDGLDVWLVASFEDGVQALYASLTGDFEDRVPWATMACLDGAAIQHVTRMGAGFAFVGYEPGTGRELWFASPDKTELLVDLAPGEASSDPRDLVTDADRHIFFSAYHPDYGREPWQHDLHSGATRWIADLLPGIRSSCPTHLTWVQPHLFFAAKDEGSSAMFRFTPAVKDEWISEETGPFSRAGVRSLEMRGGARKAL